jgi:DNA-binding beta-propeller fold protein YncE
VCEIEVTLQEILLDVTPSSIRQDGSRAWLAAPDDASIVGVDLDESTVATSLAVEDSVVDVVPGGGSLWAITYEFSFGPMLRIGPADGSTEASIEEPGGAPLAVSAGDNEAWAVFDGEGRVIRVDVAANQVTDVIGEAEFAGGRGMVDIAIDGGFVWAIDESTGSVLRIDAASRSVDLTVGDLGYAAESTGDTTTILADGARALAVTADGVWVLADTVNAGGGANVVGGGALFLLDRGTGTVVRRIDLHLEPHFGRPGLAMTDDAAWYIDTIDGYPVRVDLKTERQTYLRLNNAFGIGLITDGATVWVAAEHLFEDSRIYSIDTAEATAATTALAD